jgi:hypothetical protein
VYCVVDVCALMAAMAMAVKDVAAEEANEEEATANDQMTAGFAMQYDEDELMKHLPPSTPGLIFVGW